MTSARYLLIVFVYTVLTYWWFVMIYKDSFVT